MVKKLNPNSATSAIALEGRPRCRLGLAVLLLLSSFVTGSAQATADRQAVAADRGEIAAATTEALVSRCGEG